MEVGLELLGELLEKGSRDTPGSGEDDRVVGEDKERCPDKV